MISASHLHPMLVHFPIALVAFGFLADFASLFLKEKAFLSKLGFYLLIGGSLTALLALLAGLLFTSEMSGAANQVKESHELFAWITLGTLSVTAALRIFLKIKDSENIHLKWVAFILFALSTLFVGITGYFGGTLVYNYMMPL